MVFLFDNPVDNSRWYYHASWREDYEEQLRLKAKYSNQAGWNEFLAQRETALMELAGKLDINSPVDLKSIKRWPTPPKMTNFLHDPKRKELFEYLLQWYYHTLSAASHITGPRLIPAMHLLSNANVIGPYAINPRLYKSEAICDLDTFILAILSECIIEMGLKKISEAKYIWTLLSDITPYAKGLYELRYQSLF